MGSSCIRAFPDYRLVLTPPIGAEIVEVLARPELREKFAELANLDTARVLAILEQADEIEHPVDEADVARDRKDNKFLAAAAAAGADYLVTEDSDLFDLRFYHGIPIVTAQGFLDDLFEHRRGDAA